jgi:hypothetical protein
MSAPYGVDADDGNAGPADAGRWTGRRRILPTTDGKVSVNFAAWFPIFVAMVLFTGALLVHLATHDVAYMPKWAWAAFLVLTMPLGGFAYLAVVVFGAGTPREDAEGRHPDR